jgi:xanthosine utilization system XapX-like protein
VPLRDVRSYEPGRYYWSAAFVRVLGPGVKALRVSLAAAQGVGLVFALLVLRRIVPSVIALAVLGLILVVWMWPMYRSFENVAVLALVLAAVRVVERPITSRWCVAGVVVGLAAFVRIDHGVYGTLAFLLLLVFAAVRLDGVRPWRALVSGALGAIMGYSPMLLLAVLAPGFADGFAANLAYMARTTLWAGTVSLPRPAPWLWTVLPKLGGRSLPDAAALLTLGTLFTLLPVVLVLSGYIAWRARGTATPRQAELAAAAAVGLPYLSHTFSRADLQHLTPTAMALVVAVTALVASLPDATRRLATIVALPLAGVASYLVVVTETPYGIRMQHPETYVRSDVAGDTLWLNRSTVEIVDGVKRATAAHVGAAPLLVIPLWPGMYPILGKVAPLWEVYSLFPEPESQQQAAIARLRRLGVDWVVLADIVPEPREDLRFSNTHRVMWEHFKQDFDWLVIDPRHPFVYLLRRRVPAER